MDWGFRGLITLVFTIKALSAESFKDLPTECFNYMEIIDPSRSWESRPPTNNANDMNLKKGWYRILGAAGNSLQQGYTNNVPVGQSLPNYCGSIWSGTLLGAHPLESEGIVPMTVCFRERWCMHNNVPTCPCMDERIVYVRNCRRYFIYWLSPTADKGRYCTGSTPLEGPTIRNGSSDALECGKHSIMNDDTRGWNTQAFLSCDVNSKGWFRFTGNSGTEIASTCTTTARMGSNRMRQPCGATFRGWMVDKHPAVADGRVQRRVCFSYADTCACEFYSNVAVRNCGQFQVYRFDGVPICNAKYCAARKNETSKVTDKKKQLPPLPRKDLCKTYKVSYDPDRLWSYSSPTVYKCDANFYGRYRFGSMYTPWKIKEGCNQNDMHIVTHRCGSGLQGYMEGTHPEVVDGIVERIICFTDKEVPCRCKNTTVIKVQNCNDQYFVYDFKGVPSCNSRFCMVANDSETLTIDPSKSPQYEIPEPYYIPPPPAKIIAANDNEEHLITTTTVLALIVFIVIILLIVVIVLLLFVMKRQRRESRNRRRRPSIQLSENNNDDEEAQETTPGVR